MNKQPYSNHLHCGFHNPIVDFIASADRITQLPDLYERYTSFIVMVFVVMALLRYPVA